MKTLASLAFAVMVMIALPIAQAADLTGTWHGAFELNGSSVPLTFHLVVAENAVTGAIEGLPTTPAEIHDGKVDGDKISFTANTDYQGHNYKLVFNGQLSSTGEISFTMATDDGSWSSALVAHRGAEAVQPASADAAQPAATAVPPTAVPAATATDSPDISGTWKGSFDYEGSTVPVTFHFTADGGAITGNVAGLVQGASDTPVEIHDAKLDGDTLTFWLNTPYQGETYKIVYNGKVADGKIHFTFGTDDGSWSSELTATR
jgi:hypothetical protein